jgi:DNA polymerase-3 subunit beta
VNSLPNANITLTTKNNELSVHTDNYQTGIKSFPSEEFPLIPNVEGQHSITIDPIELKKSIDMVVFAASNNETQPEISGLFLSGDGNQLKVVATDRYRLAEKSTTTQSKETIREVIIPQKAALEISRIVAASPAQTKLVINDNQIAVTIGETEIVSRLIDGQYPDYKQIIPDTFATNITIPRTELIAALKTAGIFSKTSHSVNLSYDAKKSTVTISAASSDVGESVVEVHAVVDGPDGVVAFNHYYLLDALQTISGGEVVFKLNDDSQAVVITPKEKADYLYLVMPIKH